MAGAYLSALQKGDLNVSYSYNSDGLRVSKVVNGVKTEYVWDGSSLIGQKTGNNVLVYLYAADGLAGFQYNGVNYYYLKNGQGDVVGILNSSGTLVAKYTYDAWGKLLSVIDATGADKSADSAFIGNINPVRYRSYYYDTETGLYYLQSRYYDPEVGRFVNADSVMGVNADIYTYNLFTYCGNNPIIRMDPGGCSYILDGKPYEYDGSLYDLNRYYNKEPPLAYSKALEAKKNAQQSGSTQYLPDGGTMPGGVITAERGVAVKTGSLTFIPPDCIKDLYRVDRSYADVGINALISGLDLKYGTKVTGAMIMLATTLGEVHDVTEYNMICDAIEVAAQNGTGIVVVGPRYCTDPRSWAGKMWSFSTYEQWSGIYGEWPLANNPYAAY